MKFGWLRASALCCSTLLATQAVAQGVLPSGADGFTGYGSVEDWNIFIDNARKSCLIETVDPAGNVVQMGLTEDRAVGYVGVFTKADIGAKQGKTGAVAVAIGENVYIGEATQLKSSITEGYSGGYILSDSPQFAIDLAQQYEMIVFPEEAFSFSVDLSGTKKAMEAARKCNQEQIAG